MRRIHPAVAALLLLSVVGLALRLWGIQHGLPHPASRPDEREVLDHTAQFATGDWNPRWFIYPPFYSTLLGFWAKPFLPAGGLGDHGPATFSPFRRPRAPCSPA